MIIEEFIGIKLESLSRSIIATPLTRENLDSFSQANNGANDALLTQMAVQYGYKIALEAVADNYFKTE